MLDSTVLTIGFVRRFSPYKRANLTFADKEFASIKGDIL